MQQDHHVGVLLDRTGLTQVGELRSFVLPLLRSAVELTDGDDGHLEFFRQQLERPAHLGDFLLAALDLLRTAHQLEVVDNDESELVALLQSPSLRADFHHREVGRVVDEQRSIGDLSHLAGESVPVVVGHASGAQVLQQDARFGGQQTHGDLAATHLQGEHRARHAVLDRGAPQNVRAQSTFALRRSTGNDDELAWMQTVGQLVEIAEAGRDAVEVGTSTAHRLDLVEGLLQNLFEPDVVLTGAPLGDVVDLLLRAIDDVVDVTAHAAGGAVAELHDAGAGLDQATEDRALANDLRVVAGVGCGGHRRDERVQVGRAADLGEQTFTGELGGDGDRVGRLAATVEVEDRVVDGLVRRAIEVAWLEDLDDIGDGVLGQQHPAEHALLGDDVLRWGPVELAAVPSPVTARHRDDVGDTHPCSSLRLKNTGVTQWSDSSRRETVRALNRPRPDVGNKTWSAAVDSAVHAVCTQRRVTVRSLNGPVENVCPAPSG